jgi:cell division protein FtsN
MSRDYKSSGTAPGRGNPLGIGVLIGVLLGLCLALGVALYINKAPSPFVDRQQAAEKKS